jgi:choice-of-anchor C domain-containing protein
MVLQCSYTNFKEGLFMVRYITNKTAGNLKSKYRKILTSAGAGIAAAGLIVAPVAAAGPALLNGSFENGTSPGGFITPVAGDNTTISDWTVASGTVDYIGSYWVSSDGSRSIDLNGYTPGALSQTIATVAGHSYTVNFDLAGNPAGNFSSPAVKTLDVDAGGAPSSYSFDTTGHTTSNMGWQQQTFNFTAIGTSTTLTFTSTTGGASPFYGPALDNVSVAVEAPTNKDQCKNDGWKEYSVFKNQGDCVSFVATKGKNLPSGI